MYSYTRYLNGLCTLRLWLGRCTYFTELSCTMPVTVDKAEWFWSNLRNLGWGHVTDVANWPGWALHRNSKAKYKGPAVPLEVTLISKSAYSTVAREVLSWQLWLQCSPILLTHRTQYKNRAKSERLSWQKRSMTWCFANLMVVPILHTWNRAKLLKFGMLSYHR